MSRLRAGSIRTAAPYLLLLLLCGIVFLWRLGAYGIFDLDEGLYTEAAREMRLTGDYVTPRTNGEPFFEKPPLIYWMGAAGMALLGRSELAVRLWPALATTLLVLVTAAFGTRWFGRRAGLLAGLALALSPLVFGAARQLTTDSSLCLFTSLALYSSWMAVNRRSGPYPLPAAPCTLAFWACCGLGVMAKGLPGILIPALVAGGCLLVECRFQVAAVLRRVMQASSALGVLLFLAIILPWHFAAWRADGQAFIHEWIVRQHLQRFQGGDTAHHAPFWFYFPVLLVGFFPWSFFLPAAAIPLFRRRTGPSAPRRATRAFLLVWCLTVFILFSVMGSKLVSYILPMFAPAALLVGEWLARALRVPAPRALRRAAVAAGALAYALWLVAALHQPILQLVEARTHRPVAVPPEMLDFATHLLGAAALATVLFLALMLLRRPSWALGALALGMLALFGVAITEGLSVVDSLYLKPLHTLAEEAPALGVPDPHMLVFVGAPSRPSVLFYLPAAWLRERRVVVRRSGPAPLKLAHGQTVIILTDAPRAREIEAGFPGVKERGRRDRWVLLEADDYTVG